LSRKLGGEPTAGWINQVENEIIKDPSYTKIKKIADFFESLKLEKGIPVGKKASKIISFKVGDSLKNIHNVMSAKGISQVLIKYRNQPVGMLSTRLIFRLQNFGEYDVKVREDILEPIPPIIQYNVPINKVRGWFDHWDYLVIAKDGDITHILTVDDMNELGFVKN
jgi:predicted transcriptional regulator